MKRLPQARVDLRVMDLSAELMVCDDDRRLVHILNSTARRIWELCDGTHSTEEIAGELVRMFPGVAPEKVREDVGQALADLEAKGMIAWVSEEVKEAGD